MGVHKETTLLKLAIIEPVGSHAGLDVYIINSASCLVRLGWQVNIYTSDVQNIPDDIAVYRVFKGVFDGRNKVLALLRYMVGGLQALISARMQGIKVVHYHFFEYRVQELYLVILARLMGMAPVITAHDIESFDTKKNDQVRTQCMALASRIIVNNAFSGRIMAEHEPKARAKCDLVPHGDYLNMAEIAPDRKTARTQLLLNEDSPVFLFIGQIKKSKGLDVFIEAAKLIIQQHPKARFIIAGKVWRTTFDDYQAQIDKLGLGANVFTDIRFIPQHELLNYLAACDFLVLPYRRIYQSGILLMALGMRKVVISSDLPAMLETITHGQNGFVFKSEDAVDMGRVCNELLGGDHDLYTVAEQAHGYIIDHHLWDGVAKALEQVYTRAFRLT